MTENDEEFHEEGELDLLETYDRFMKPIVEEKYMHDTNLQRYLQGSKFKRVMRMA